MTRTEQAETGLRPALSANETVAGRLARTYVELGYRELNGLGSENSRCGQVAIGYRAEEAQWEAEARQERGRQS